MWKFSTYKIGPGTVRSGWFWQVTKEVGPMVLVVARSGQGYAQEDYAVAAYKEFVKWASGNSTGTTPPTDT